MIITPTKQITKFTELHTCIMHLGHRTGVMVRGVLSSDHNGNLWTYWYKESWHDWKESLGKVNAKDLELTSRTGRSTNYFYRLKALITLEQVNTSRRNLNEQHVDQCRW